MSNRLNDTVIFIAALVASAAVAVAIPASAATPDDTATSEVHHVHTADLNLAAPADVKRLRARIAAAARQVCGNATDPLSYNDPDFSNCVKTATEDAWAQAEKLIASKTSHTLLASATPQR